MNNRINKIFNKIFNKTEPDLNELEKNEEALKAFWEDITMEYDFWISFDEFKKKINNDVPVRSIAKNYQDEIDENGGTDE